MPQDGLKCCSVWASHGDTFAFVCRGCLISLIVSGQWLRDSKGRMLNCLHEFATWGACDVCNTTPGVAVGPVACTHCTDYTI